MVCYDKRGCWQHRKESPDHMTVILNEEFKYQAKGPRHNLDKFGVATGTYDDGDIGHSGWCPFCTVTGKGWSLK